MVVRSESLKIHQELLRLLPGGVNSPVRACSAVETDPVIAERGEGAILFDADGNGYIDYCGSWGALIHGHAHPEIIKAVQETAQKGTSFGVSTLLEAQLARKVTELVPSIEKVRFVSSGTEATMSAVRLARGHTGRDLILKFEGHYHGHADYFLVQAGSGALDLNSPPSSQGIPLDFVKNTLCLPFNDIHALETIFSNSKIAKNLAAVILEPIAGNMGVVPADREWMELLRKKTEENGTVLIFDEVMTGFRVAKGGAQSLYGIRPDLTCLGKIVGGGLPAAAFGGKQEIMDKLAPQGQVYQAGTLSGNPLAMAAGLKSLELLDVPGFYETMQHKTELLLQDIKNFILDEEIEACVQSKGSMFTLFIGKRYIENGSQAKALDRTPYARLFKSMLEKGIYLPPLQQEACFVSMAHTETQLAKTKECMIEFLSSLCYVKS